MPYVSTDSNLTLTHDVNEEIEQLWGMQPWNEKYEKDAKPLQLTFGDLVPLETKGGKKTLAKYIHRGDRSPERGYFVNNQVVYRITLEDFSLYNQIRFLERFVGKPTLGPIPIFYEPTAYDFRNETVGDHKGLQLPMWLQDWTLGQKLVQKAEKLVKLPGLPEVEKDDYAGDPGLTELIIDSYKKSKEDPKNTYAVYSKTEEFQKFADRLAPFKLKEMEDLALGRLTSSDKKEDKEPENKRNAALV